MKKIMTILSVLAISFSVNAEVFKGAFGKCGSTLTESEKIELIQRTTEIAVANCVKSNFNTEDCLSAKPVSDVTYSYLSGGGSSCNGSLVSTYIQVGKPACN